MPSGRTHDAITVFLALPAFAATYAVTGDPFASATVAVAFIFGGVMFGPDLDTVSRQYSRWFIFRFLWYPYRSFFKHRSRFSHGLIFGALIRVVYFLGVLTIAVYLAAVAWYGIAGDHTPALSDFAEAWRSIGTFVRRNLGDNFMLLAFIGLWLGAASHTFTDMAGSFIKTGRIVKFL
ncbi:MAG TPA: metal-binding protein [Pyrinomonadaceae bacterium]|nr:metal-binding protein [Pyrinomonadaceae bacterium]